ELYTAKHRRDLADEVLRRMALLPGVKSVGLAENGPLGSRTGVDEVQASGSESGAQPIRVEFDRVSSGYFAAIGIPLIQGRDFSAADRPGAPTVVIINDALAHELFKEQDPLGRKIRRVGEGPDSECEVVGVVKATRYYDLHLDPQPAIYTTTRQDAPYMPTLHVRAESDRTALVIAEVRAEFDAIDKNFPVFNIRTLQDRVDDSLASERLVGQLAGGFGALALVLASIGIYGIMAYSVTGRRREIGVRMALGGSSKSVLGMILKEGMLLVLAGIAIGSPAAVGAGRIASRIMPGLARVDPVTLISAPLIMAAVALLAALIPARRAVRVNPTIALRNE
ncbi:MAG: FtsX-like permease family protein, partial [Blastocatellia bacterium]